jgi:cytoskeletal protein RodZ
MQNVGDRLAEARKRLGIALREASEATKIRTDYLQEMESGSFDFSLPEIYKVGFLKIYARFLKLDADKLAADYTMQFSSVGRSDRENLGRMDSPASHVAGGATVGHETSIASEYDEDSAKKKAELIRLVAFLGLALVILVVLIIGLQHLLNSGTTPDNTTKPATADNTPNPEAAPPAPAPEPSVTPVTPAVPPPLNLIFAASGNISSLQIIQVGDRQILYNKSLNKGASLPLTSKGPVEVKVSQTQFLTIKVNSGVAQGIADANRKPITGALDFVWPP